MTDETEGFKQMIKKAITTDAKIEELPSSHADLTRRVKVFSSSNEGNSGWPKEHNFSFNNSEKHNVYDTETRSSIDTPVFSSSTSCYRERESNFVSLNESLISTSTLPSHGHNSPHKDNSACNLDFNVDADLQHFSQDEQYLMLGSLTGGLDSSDDSLILKETDVETMTSGNPNEQHFSDHRDPPVGAGDWHCHDEEGLKTDVVARRQLIIVCVLCTLFMIGEAIGGALSNSLALFTDVLHLASDLISFIISLLAMHLANKAATKSMTFGFHRAEVLGALFSVFIIWMVTGVLCYMAVERISNHKNEIKPDQMVITASLGVVFNIVMGIVLQVDRCCGKIHSHAKFGHSHGIGGHGHSHGNAHSHLINASGVDYQPLHTEEDVREGYHSDIEVGDQEEFHDTRAHRHHDHRGHKNINVRAAFIHVIGDIIQSIGVLIASVIIKIDPEKFRIADPICTFMFSVLVIITTVGVFRDTLRVMMEGKPKDVDFDAIKADLKKIPGVCDVHTLLLWSLTIDRNALAVHVAIDPSSSHQKVLECAKEVLRKHNFLESVIQVEHYNNASRNCRECIGPIK